MVKSEYFLPNMNQQSFPLGNGVKGDIDLGRYVWVEVKPHVCYVVLYIMFYVFP